MAQRKWIAKWSMGYQGTDSEEELDLVDDCGFSEGEVKAMSDDDARAVVSKWAWDIAIEKVDAWAEEA